MVNGLEVTKIGTKKVQIQYREVFDRDTWEEDFFLGTFDSEKYRRVIAYVRGDLRTGTKKSYPIQGDHNLVLITTADNGTINFSMVSGNSLILRTGVHIEDLCFA